MSFTPAALANLIDSLRGSCSPEDLIPPFAKACVQAWGFPWLAVYLADADRLRLLTAAGDGAAPNDAFVDSGDDPRWRVFCGARQVGESPDGSRIEAIGPDERPEGVVVTGASPDATQDVVRGIARLLAAVLGRARALNELRQDRDRTAEAMSRQRHAEESKDRFLSAVSHEFRTPLTSIRSFSEILLTHAPEDPETTQEFISIIHEESVRLSRLVNNLLDLSKMQAGRMEWDFRENDLGGAIRRATKSVASVVADRQISIEERLASAGHPVVFDLDKIIQVLVNLISNAAKFSPAGGIVTVEATSGPEGARLQVRDSGPGIPEADRERIFERFSQLGGGRRDHPGTGLGLSISREIVHAHGGRIWVEEAPDRGSIFLFELPPHPRGEGRAGEQKDESPAAEPVPEPDAAGRTLLVADDDENFRRFLQFELASSGYRVLEAGSATEAVHLARAELPDLMVLDLRLPDLGGEDVLTLLENGRETAAIPVLVVSVEPLDKGARLVPPDRVLRKPIDIVDLRTAVARVLSRE